MTAPRRLTAAFIALGIISLSCNATPPSGDAGIAPAPFSYAAFESSEEAYRAAEALGNLHTGLLPVEISRVSVAIAAESSRADLPVELVLALIQVESSGYNFAVSAVGAMGLMQLMPETAEGVAQRLGLRWEGPPTLFDPISNVQLGIAYLRELVDRYGSVKTALAAYNWGPTRIAERLRLGKPVPAVYARRVLSVYEKARHATLQI
ncbi:MAG: lytic transglycosylase domain-containing protein [Deltaproteobacteria bacterium]|jgi:soluble lytic murein transglycosylase|nr:lytic transglycosylase domain-containing protein [Deltaproteobacteria bacterium]